RPASRIGPRCAVSRRRSCICMGSWSRALDARWATLRHWRRRRKRRRKLCDRRGDRRRLALARVLKGRYRRRQARASGRALVAFQPFLSTPVKLVLLTLVFFARREDLSRHFLQFG